jgi:hypothetical protein
VTVRPSGESASTERTRSPRSRVCEVSLGMEL